METLARAAALFEGQRADAAGALSGEASGGAA